MALTKIPDGFQQSILASSINTFGRAVEELVCNSVDAGASSVAIRVSVKNYFIQVIDNGVGVNQKDLVSMGKIYMTSKFENWQNREPSYYGFRGQSISNIVKVARVVKISSRCDGSKETWSKEFISGVEQDIKKIEQRPSKGTTVEIKGFFYNAVIRRKAIEEINELNNIKSILEKIAVVNTNLSLSLRNNSNMEILLTIHKNRDIIQTLGLLNGIDINKLKELQVEKNQYKVKAYIVSDEVNEVKYKYKWIYLNKLFLNNRKIQNTFDGFLKKHRFGSLENKQSKLKEEIGNIPNQKTIPSYFILISCPYDEYDISRSPKQSFIEFKNWDNLTKILEKLTKFYIGDLKIEDNPNVKAIIDSKVDKEDTRSQVRKIIERVLGNKSKNTKNTRMQNGVTGKYAKRKQKKSKNSNKKEKTSEVQKKDNIFLLNANPCIQISPTIMCKTKVMAPHCAADIQNGKSISKEIEQHTFNLSHLKESLEKANSQNSQNEFRENCAALKRKCDDLEIKVDRMLMRPKTKKLKKCSITLSNSKSANIAYTNIIRNDTNIISRRTFKSTTLLKHNINETSPYFPTNIYRKIESSSPQVFAYKPVIEYECNVPNITSKTLHLPLAESNYQSHQEFSIDTFQSHCFHLRSENDIQNIRKFISKQSIDNFGLQQNVISKTYANKTRKDTRYTFIPRNKNINVDLRATASSYTIEFSKTNDFKNYEPKRISSRKQNTFTYNQQLLFNNNKEHKRYFSKNHEFRDPCSTVQKRFIGDSDLGDSNDKSCSFRNPNVLCNYPLEYETRNLRSPSCQNTKDNRVVDFISPSTCIPSTYNYHKTIQSICTSNIIYQTYENIGDEYGLPEKNDSLIVYREADNKTGSTQIMFQTSDVDVVFVSELQRQYTSMPQNVNPFEICEVFLNDSDCTKGKRNDDVQPCTNFSYQSAGVKDSYNCIHNSDLDNTLIKLLDGLSLSNSFDHGSLVPFNLTEELRKNNEKTNTMLDNDKQMPETENEVSSYFINDFVIKDRQRFLPKGMSPLNDCVAQHSKCAIPCDKEYFDPIIYFNFLDNLQTNSKIYEPDVQNMKTVGTKGIQNFQEKVIKDNASLVFTGKALEKANIFGQVDNKFIAATIEGNSNRSMETAKFLVLFDQHAIHERIRLENNLLDYLDDDNWKTVDIDDITLKLTTDEILYVHNYKEKFEKFGLKWTSKNNCEIGVIGIPKAILGTNLRQEDKVMIAVKQIILEIIKSLQTQRGCVPLYLKTIMDLVFSEACRYAIKFGDKLTLDECKELLLDLSHCKTPFQCAHGRPVMAVLMELKNNNIEEYSINKTKLLGFLKKNMEEESRNF